MEELTGVDFTITYDDSPLTPEDVSVITNDDGNEYPVTPGTPLTIDNLEGSPVFSVKVTGTNIATVTVTPVDENGDELPQVTFGPDVTEELNYQPVNALIFEITPINPTQEVTVDQVEGIFCVEEVTTVSGPSTAGPTQPTTESATTETTSVSGTTQQQPTTAGTTETPTTERPCDNAEGMANPSYIPPGSISSTIQTDNDIENIRPGGDLLTIPDDQNEGVSLTIQLGTKTELGNIEIVPDSDTSNIETYIVSIKNEGDLSSTQIGSVYNGDQIATFPVNTFADQVIVTLLTKNNANEPYHIDLKVHACFVQVTTTAGTTTTIAGTTKAQPTTGATVTPPVTTAEATTATPPGSTTGATTSTSSVPTTSTPAAPTTSPKTGTPTGTTAGTTQAATTSATEGTTPEECDKASLMEEVQGVSFTIKYGGNTLSEEDQSALESDDNDGYTLVGNSPLTIEGLDGSTVYSVTIIGSNIKAATLIPTDDSNVQLPAVDLNPGVENTLGYIEVNALSVTFTKVNPAENLQIDQIEVIICQEVTTTAGTTTTVAGTTKAQPTTGATVSPQVTTAEATTATPPVSTTGATTATPSVPVTPSGSTTRQPAEATTEEITTASVPTLPTPPGTTTEKVEIANPTEPPIPPLCDEPLGMDGNAFSGTISYSSNLQDSGEGSLTSLWSPQTGSEDDSYVQVEFGRGGFIIKIQVTGGSVNAGISGFVERINIEILEDENDPESWQSIGVFDANTDIDTTADVVFPEPEFGFGIRVSPVEWTDTPVMGMEIFGCLLPPTPPETTSQAPSTTPAVSSSTVSGTTVKPTPSPSSTVIPPTPSSTVPPPTTVEQLTTTVSFTTTAGPPAMCEFSQEVYKDNFGYEQIDLIGYIEKDGQEGITSEDEKVFVGAMVEEGVLVIVGCSNCTCNAAGLFNCEIGECEECRYTEWTDWTECSKDCDVGSRSRERIKLSVTTPDRCADDIIEREDCNVQRCPTPTTLAPCEPWDEWSECSSGPNDPPCTEGVIIRERNCGGTVDREIESCSNECPPNPECEDPLVLWEEPRCNMTCYMINYPESCSDTETYEPRCGCKEGFVMNDNSECIPVEECTCYSMNGLPVNVGMTSPGASVCEECTCIEPGNYQCSMIEDCCEWSDWSDWGVCSEDCTTGVKTRYRDLLAGNADYCGSSTETSSCEPEPTAECFVCHYDGQDYAVGDLITTQNDRCVKCYCDSNYEEYCVKDQNSNVNGNWSAWTEWSSCTLSCDGGMKTRTRTCTNPLPMCDGDPCEGDNQEYEPCNVDVPCCGVTNWGDWSECSMPCVPGELQVRTRNLVAPYTSAECPGVNLFESRNCTQENCECVYDYSETGVCISTNGQDCGSGRQMVTGTLVSGGSDCPNEHVIQEDCQLEPCVCEGDNEMWSSYSTCAEKYCNNITNPIEMDANCETEGCICADQYYRNDDGECVTLEECAKCRHMDIDRLPGDLFENPADSCELCECVNGDTVCTRKCSEPTECLPGEVLDYENEDSCCRVCMPEKTTCQQVTETTVLSNGVCRSRTNVTISYCTGGCGTSVMIPQLMPIGDQDASAFVQHCKCCTGEVASYIDVPIDCDDPSLGTTAMIPVLKPNSCTCNACLGAGSGVDSNPMGTRRR